MEAEVITGMVPLLIQVLGASHPVVQGLTLLTSLIGGASALAKMITYVTRITPNTKDDLMASKLEKGVSKVVAVLDKVALNPNEQEARRR